MNARTALVTSALTVSLIVPSAASALRYNIPAEAPLSKQSVVHVLEANSSTLGLRAYRSWAAYVPGGSSQKVAKAITAAAKTRAANDCASTAQRRVLC
jgi:hypothetical protein